MTLQVFSDVNFNGIYESGTDLAGRRRRQRRQRQPDTRFRVHPGPGNFLPSSAFLVYQKPGSVLIYNLYTSTANTARQNTQFNLTNTHPLLPVNGYLFFFGVMSLSYSFFPDTLWPPH